MLAPPRETHHGFVEVPYVSLRFSPHGGEVSPRTCVRSLFRHCVHPPRNALLGHVSQLLDFSRFPPLCQQQDIEERERERGCKPRASFVDGAFNLSERSCCHRARLSASRNSGAFASADLGRPPPARRRWRSASSPTPAPERPPRGRPSSARRSGCLGALPYGTPGVASKRRPSIRAVGGRMRTNSTICGARAEVGLCSSLRAPRRVASLGVPCPRPHLPPRSAAGRGSDMARTRVALRLSERERGARRARRDKRGQIDRLGRKARSKGPVKALGAGGQEAGGVSNWTQSNKLLRRRCANAMGGGPKGFMAPSAARPLERGVIALRGKGGHRRQQRAGTQHRHNTSDGKGRPGAKRAPSAQSFLSSSPPGANEAALHPPRRLPSTNPPTGPRAALPNHPRRPQDRRATRPRVQRPNPGRTQGLRSGGAGPAKRRRV